MYKFFAIIATIILLGSCGICAKIPREDVHIVVRDSVAISVKDSINWIPKEVLMEVAPVDSSHLETTYAISDAWVDSLALLHHKLVQKPVKSEYKEKEIIKIQRDTTFIKVPVEVIKEKKIHYKYEKWLWFISMIALAYFGYKFYRFILRFSGADIGSLFKKF